MINEKIFQSRLMEIADTIYKLIIFNLLFILTLFIGLGVFTFLLALIILVLAIKSFGERSDSIIKTWINMVFQHGWKTLKYSLVFLGLIIVFLFNSVYFYLVLEEMSHWMYSVMFSFSLICLLISVAALINGAFVFVYYPNLPFKKWIKYSFSLLRVFPLQTLYLIGNIVVSILLLYTVPIVLVFIYPSLSTYLYHLMTKKTYKRLVAEGVESLKFQIDPNKLPGGHI